MKKLFTILSIITATIVTVNNAQAQLVTITAANQMPAVGDTVHYVDANSFGFDPTGTGPVTAKVWDNSLLMTSGTSYDYYYIAASTASISLGRDSFPTATIARGESGATGYFYYNNTAGNINRVGWFGAASNYGIYEDNTVATEYHFPITAGNTYNSTYYGRFARFNVGEDSVNIESGTLTINADMQGTLILPTGTFTNVLRLHVLETFHIKTYLFGLAVQDDIVQDDYYYWFSENYLSALLVSGVTSINGSGQTPVLRYQPIVISGINNISALKPSIFPNPSNGKFTVETKGSLANGSLSVYNAMGQEVYSERIENTSASLNVDLSNLQKGIYFVKLTDSQGVIATEKINIE